MKGIDVMSKEIIIKARVTEEEKYIIDTKAKRLGYANTASYIKDMCLNDVDGGLAIWQKCEIRDSLQRIDKMYGSDKRVHCHLNRINDVLEGRRDLNG